MRWTVIMLLGLSGCAEGAGAFGMAELASVVVFGRGIGDLGVSAATGRDCSVVRLDRGMTYCAPRDGTPPAPAFCTRSLGTVDCWADPRLLPAPSAGVADTPAPNADQIRFRAARWPKSLAF